MLCLRRTLGSPPTYAAKCSFDNPLFWYVDLPFINSEDSGNWRQALFRPKLPHNKKLRLFEKLKKFSFLIFLQNNNICLQILFRFFFWKLLSENRSLNLKWAGALTIWPKSYVPSGYTPLASGLIFLLRRLWLWN